MIDLNTFRVALNLLKTCRRNPNLRPTRGLKSGIGTVWSDIILSFLKTQYNIFVLHFKTIQYIVISQSNYNILQYIAIFNIQYGILTSEPIYSVSLSSDWFATSSTSQSGLLTTSETKAIFQRRWFCLRNSKASRARGNRRRRLSEMIRLPIEKSCSTWFYVGTRNLVSINAEVLDCCILCRLSVRSAKDKSKSSSSSRLLVFGV